MENIIQTGISAGATTRILRLMNLLVSAESNGALRSHCERQTGFCGASSVHLQQHGAEVSVCLTGLQHLIGLYSHRNNYFII